jgi:hypothetical protein
MTFGRGLLASERAHVAHTSIQVAIELTSGRDT